MALDLLSDSWASWPPSPSAGTAISSPRLSFSCDLDSSEDHRPRHRCDNSLVAGDSLCSSDFDFCVARDRSEQEYSSAADELFSDGFLLPLCFLSKGESNPTAPTSPATLPNSNTASTSTTAASNNSSGSSSNSNAVKYAASSTLTTLQVPNKKQSQKEAVAEPGSSDAPDDTPAIGKQPSSLWRFGRSSSLNYGGRGGGDAAGGRRGSLIFSLSLLSRSKSAGSNPAPAATKSRHQHLQNSTSAAAANAGSGSSKLLRKGSNNGGCAASRSPYYYGQKHHGNVGVRISPVLNVPPPYIPRGSSAGIFSLGHLLCSGKDKSRKKTQLPPSP